MASTEPTIPAEATVVDASNFATIVKICFDGVEGHKFEALAPLITRLWMTIRQAGVRGDIVFNGFNPHHGNIRTTLIALYTEGNLGDIDPSLELAISQARDVEASLAKMASTAV